MEVLHPIVVIALIVAWVATLVWILNDVTDQFGFEGCLVFGCLYVFLFPLFPLIAIGYLLLKARFYGSGRIKTDDAERVTQWNWRRAGQSKGTRPARPSTPPEISAAESNEEIDVLLAEGKAQEALERATELLETAESFGDSSGMKRYRKYMDYIKLGGYLRRQ